MKFHLAAKDTRFSSLEVIFPRVFLLQFNGRQPGRIVSIKKAEQIVPPCLVD